MPQDSEKKPAQAYLFSDKVEANILNVCLLLFLEFKR